MSNSDAWNVQERKTMAPPNNDAGNSQETLGVQPTPDSGCVFCKNPCEEGLACDGCWLTELEKMHGRAMYAGQPMPKSVSKCYYCGKSGEECRFCVKKVIQESGEATRKIAGHPVSDRLCLYCKKSCEGWCCVACQDLELEMIYSKAAAKRKIAVQPTPDSGCVFCKNPCKGPACATCVDRELQKMHCRAMTIRSIADMYAAGEPIPGSVSRCYYCGKPREECGFCLTELLNLQERGEATWRIAGHQPFPVSDSGEIREDCFSSFQELEKEVWRRTSPSKRFSRTESAATGSGTSLWNHPERAVDWGQELRREPLANIQLRFGDVGTDARLLNLPAEQHLPPPAPGQAHLTTADEEKFVNQRRLHPSAKQHLPPPAPGQAHLTTADEEATSTSISNKRMNLQQTIKALEDSVLNGSFDGRTAELKVEVNRIKANIQNRLETAKRKTMQDIEKADAKINHNVKLPKEIIDLRLAIVKYGLPHLDKEASEFVKSTLQRARRSLEEFEITKQLLLSQSGLQMQQAYATANGNQVYMQQRICYMQRLLDQDREEKRSNEKQGTSSKRKTRPPKRKPHK